MKDNSYSISNFFLSINQILWKIPFLQNSRVLYYFVDSILLLGTKSKAKTYDGKKKVLIVYNMALGDGVMFLGVAHHFRNIYPKEKYELTIACQSVFSSLYEESGIFDCVMSCDFAGSIVNLKNRRKLFRNIRKEKYDIVVDPVGCDNCTTNVFVTRAARGIEKIGVLDKTLPHVQCPKWMRNCIYSRVIEIDKPNLHLIEFYAELIKKLGDNTCVAHPAKFTKIDIYGDIPEKFFIIFPTASMGVKRWPLNRYAYLAKKIQEKTNMPLVVCGTNHDLPIINEFLELIPKVRTINFVGKTNIREFIELIRRASLIVTNDTSAYHIAVAQQCNVALICGGYTYNRYAKYDYERYGYKNPVLIRDEMECYNCNNYCVYSTKNIFPCIDRITKEKAWSEISRMIELAEEI